MREFLPSAGPFLPLLFSLVLLAPGCVPSVGLDDDDTSGDCTIAEPERHRGAPAACQPNDAADPTEEEIQEVVDSGGIPDCLTDADCGGNGQCIFYETYNPFIECFHDSCLTDDDCEGGVCLCGEGYRGHNNVCIHAECEVNANCGADNWCGISENDCGMGTGAYCMTCDDECSVDGDCDPAPPHVDCTYGCIGRCRFQGATTRWACEYDTGDSCYD
jgi:hypothetical protein